MGTDTQCTQHEGELRRGPRLAAGSLVSLRGVLLCLRSFFDGLYVDLLLL